MKKSSKWDTIAKGIDSVSTLLWHAITTGVSAILMLVSIRSTLDDLEHLKHHKW